MVVVPEWPTITGVGLVSEITYMDNHGKPVGKEPNRTKRIVGSPKIEADLKAALNVVRGFTIGNIIDNTQGKKELIDWKKAAETLSLVP